jgi:hypothetical protein
VPQKETHHQSVHYYLQRPNLFKLLISQSDLLLLLLVILNVYLVLKLKVTVLLVMKTEAIHQLALVMMVIIKIL